MAQERLLQELKELIVAYLAELEALLEGLREGQLDPEALAQLKQRYQLAQGKLQELEGNKHVLLAKGEPSRSLSETLRTLKEEKGQLEREVERLKGLERAYVQVQLEATRLEEQLHHSNDEMQQLRSKHDQLTKQYIRAFGGRKP